MSINALFWILCGIYLLGWAFFCLSFFNIKEGARNWGIGALIIGLVGHLVLIGFSAIEVSDFIFRSLSGLFIFLSLLSILLYFILNFYFPNRILGVTFPPLSVFILLLSVMSADLKIISPFFLDSSRIIHKIALYAHGSASMVAYLLFVIASLMSFFFLYQENRIKKKTLPLDQANIPSLGTLEETTFKVIALGFILFSGGLILGVGMSVFASNASMTISVRQGFPLLTWVLYVAFLIDRSLNGSRGKITAIWSIVAGFTAVFSFIYEMSLLTGGD